MAPGYFTINNCLFFLFVLVNSGRSSLISAFRVKHSVAQLCGNLFCFLKLATIRWTHIWCCANAWSRRSFSCSNLLKNVHTRKYSIDDKNTTFWRAGKSVFGVTTYILLFWSLSSCRTLRAPLWLPFIPCSVTASVMLKSELWGGQSMTDSLPWCVFLIRYAQWQCVWLQGGDPRHFTDLSIRHCCHNSFSSSTNPQMTEPPCLQVVDFTPDLNRLNFGFSDTTPVHLMS